MRSKRKDVWGNPNRSLLLLIPLFKRRFRDPKSEPVEGGLLYFCFGGGEGRYPRIARGAHSNNASIFFFGGE